MRKVFGIFISMFTVCFAQTKIQKEIGLSQSPAGRLASGEGGESSIPDETEAMEAMDFAKAIKAYRTTKRNVLVFFIDDLGPELGCCGVEVVENLQIDKLISEGAHFEGKHHTAFSGRIYHDCFGDQRYYWTERLDDLIGEYADPGALTLIAERIKGARARGLTNVALLETQRSRDLPSVLSEFIRATRVSGNHGNTPLTAQLKESDQGEV